MYYDLHWYGRVLYCLIKCIVAIPLLITLLMVINTPILEMDAKSNLCAVLKSKGDLQLVSGLR